MENKLGLALGGGAVLGAAHIGVLKAMEENHLSISAISGTSIGALVAAFYAFGNSYDDIENMILDIGWSDISSFTLSKLGLMTNKKIEKLIHKHIGEVNIEDSEIPLRIVSTNINDGSMYLFEKGDLAQAVMASTCLPGVYEPIRNNGALLVDGGIVENVPISPLKGMKLDKIIAVDLNTNHNYGTPKNMVELLVNSFHYLLAAVVKSQIKETDVLIQPDMTKFNLYDTKQVRQLVKVGYDTAKDKFKQSALLV